jgi:hypothetical protein
MSTEQHQDNQNIPPGRQKPITIIVNARSKTITERELTFREVVALAFPNPVFSDTIIYTVTYKRGEGKKPEGSLVEGESVHVKEGMIFNVDKTDRS